jgi:hypothetical protein
MMGLPEIQFYAVTFWQILLSNKHAAINGMLELEVIGKKQSKTV